MWHRTQIEFQIENCKLGTGGVFLQFSKLRNMREHICYVLSLGLLDISMSHSVLYPLETPGEFLLCACQNRIIIFSTFAVGFIH